MPISLQLVYRKEGGKKNSMRRKYILKWYEYNLTKPRNKRFFTLVGACAYQFYLRVLRKTYSKLYEICAVE